MTDNAPLAHEIAGTGPLLLAIHGITENRRFWDGIGLEDHFRVLRVDLRGYGDSPRTPPYGIDRSIDDIHDLLTSIGETETPFVLGHSLGGVIATGYAAQHPTRAVVNVDQSLRVGPLPDHMKELVRGEQFEQVITSMFDGVYGELDPELISQIKLARDLDQTVFTGYWTPLLEWDQAALDTWMDRITALPPDLPYLSLHGTDPGTDYAAWLHERVPAAVIEQATVESHYPHLADPSWFVSRILKFFDA
ncbi:alpha/beta fold hydrolase [Streptomyces griseofuscus]|uniref:alpha/beta fold hydrolase n=1 Tax=Streptomyces griseofuscus TaxID=146922 RepID=UPI0033EAEF4C